MKYFVLYEEFDEYNQFEGSWNKTWNEFDSLDDAERFIDSISVCSDYRNIHFSCQYTPKL